MEIGVCGASKREKKYEDGCTHLKVRSSSFHHGVNECVESVVDVRTVGHQQQKIIQIAGLIHVDANAVAPTNSMHESSCQSRHQSSGRVCVCVCREREREREKKGICATARKQKGSTWNARTVAAEARDPRKAKVRRPN